MFVSHHTLKWTRTCRSHGRHPHAHTAHFLLNRHTGGRRYYQVSESVHDSATLDREPSSLRAVRDNYPKTLITLDDERPYSHEGIRQIYALDWLLNEDHKKQ